jgi:hypothetical protein
MVLLRTPSTCITTKGRIVSTNNGDWIYDFIPKKEADSMEAKMENIERNTNTIVTMLISATREDVIDLCKTWDKATHGDPYAWMRMSSFMEHLVDQMKDHLERGEEE